MLAGRNKKHGFLLKLLEDFETNLRKVNRTVYKIALLYRNEVFMLKSIITCILLH